MSVFRSSFYRCVAGQVCRTAAVICRGWSLFKNDGLGYPKRIGPRLPLRAQPLDGFFRRKGGACETGERRFYPRGDGGVPAAGQIKKLKGRGGQNGVTGGDQFRHGIGTEGKPAGERYFRVNGQVNQRFILIKGAEKEFCQYRASLLPYRHEVGTHD